ncbi:MAG: hypothetical protein ABIW76_23245 [Fibrobacteria bacterium]
MPSARRPGAAPAPFRAPLLSILLVAFAAWPSPATAGICGTEAWIKHRNRLSTRPPAPDSPEAAPKPGSSGNGSSSAARMAIPAAPPYRTLETPHFLLRYSLHGLHAVKRLPRDSALYRLRDSLYASLNDALPPGRARDSAVLADLDGLSAPHPAFASVMADFFERARDYYVGSLGMKPPVAYGPSPFYSAPMGSSGKYPIDIADAYQASLAMDPDYPLNPQTYGATLPPADGGMLMENDFLWRSVLDPTGSFAVGDTLKSCVPRACSEGGLPNHNYGLDWEAGLKVTCFHELYHAVQFAYTPEPSTYHAWYETGAVGMEERNAPEVDDYLQYLEGYFRHLAGTSMFDYMDIPDSNPRYGNGIFHVYLTQELGERFDVGIWERLAANGNNLKQALPAAFAARGLSAEKVFGSYAAQLSFSGRTARAPFRLFSPDMPRWPRLREKPLNADTLTVYRSENQAPFTIQAFRITGSAAGKALQLSAADLIPVFAAFAADTGTATTSAGAIIAMEWAGNMAEDRLLVLANASLEGSAFASIRILASLASGKLFAYPNPFRRTSDADRVLFSRLTGLTKAARIRIVTENGITVRDLTFTPDSGLWSWDLRGKNGNGNGKEKERPVLPGLYYFGTEGDALAPLVIY